MRIAILLTAMSALAFNHAARAEGPSHVKVAQCGPLIRQELRTIVGHPLVIVFPKGESTWLNPSSGRIDAKGVNGIEPVIEVIKDDKLKDNPIGNMFTLWPDEVGISTLTVVVKTTDGSIKTYPFTLTSVPDDQAALDDPRVTLNLLCSSGPVAPANTAASAPAARAGSTVAATPIPTRVNTGRRLSLNAAERADAEERLRTQSFNGAGDQTCHYHAKGKRPSAVEPMCPMDNGQWTLIRFKGLTRKPAVYIGSCEDGNDEERLARQHGAGDFVVVEEIAPQFCLRLGSGPADVLEIINDAYDPAGRDPGTGSISPGVRRDLIQAKSR
jgi:type IV secretory pathway VirB9-like protein